MKIIIAGAGAVGTHLAQLLSKDDHDIVVIDESQDKTDMLTESGNYDLMTINLPPTSIAALKEAGVQHAQLFIAVTPDESRNLNCCMLAHTLGAKKTVARVDNAEYLQQQYIDMFRNMGIDSLIYPEMLASQEIIEGLHHSWVRQYWEIHDGALIMMGIKLRDTAKILDIPLRELCPPDAPYHIVTIKRDDSTIINKKVIAASHIYQMMLDADVTTMKSLTIANADVAEFVALEGSLITQHPIREQHLPKGVALGGLIRDRIGMPINGSTIVQPGDSVVVFAIDGQVKKMDRFFRKPEGSIISKIFN